MAQPNDEAEIQETAEADVESFRDHLGPFVVAAETTRMPMVFTNARDVDNPIIFANDSFLSLLGYERSEVLGIKFNALMERCTDSNSLAQIEAAFEDSTNADTEIRYQRKDGSEFWASVFITPVHDKNGVVVQHFASLIDITAHKLAQSQSSMLINELNHRVKNTLSTVQSIVAQALRKTSDAKSIGESIESRLFALSRSHDLLTRENWQSAGLHDVVEVAMEPFGIANGRAERFVIKGDNIRFPPNASLALSIAFHELATNAVKYGAFLNETGSVHVSWTIKSMPTGKRLILCWRETGGPPVTPPTRKGFGSRVIEHGLAHELEGVVHLDYQPRGVVCTIDIPAPAEVRSE